MKTLMIALLLALPLGANAADSDYAYYGMGGMIQLGCYGAMKQTLHLESAERWKAHLFCAAFAGSVVGFTAARDESLTNQNASVGYGLAGMASTAALSFMFEF